MELIIASNNKGKIREYKDIFEPFGFQVFSQSEKNIDLEVEETGTTFEENAELKAQAVYDRTHCYVLSDDSGLEVEALNNEPGIFSARYKGLETEHERRMAILQELEGSDNRNAHFVCCICLIEDNGTKHLFKGIWNGTISFAEEGENGFGYDPIIYYPPFGKTMADMDKDEKNSISHRGKAVRLMEAWLEENGNA